MKRTPERHPADLGDLLMGVGEPDVESAAQSAAVVTRVRGRGQGPKVQ